METQDELRFFTSEQLDKLARLMVWAVKQSYASSVTTNKLRPKDFVSVSFDRDAAALASRIEPLLIHQGIHAVLRVRPISLLEKFGDSVHSMFVDQDRQKGIIALQAPREVVSKKCSFSYSMFAKAIVRAVNDRDNRGKFGWTVCVLPSKALAAEAGMSLEDYTRQVVTACQLDEPDPVASWQRTFERIKMLQDWLTAMPIEYVHMQSLDDQTNLKVWIGNYRQWCGGSGKNMPSYEVFTSPDASRVEGTFHANVTSYRNNCAVRDARLTFKDGQVCEASASAGIELLARFLKSTESMRRLGEFSLTDRRLSPISRYLATTIYDENFGGDHGNSHIALGSAIEQTYAGKRTMLTDKKLKQLQFNQSGYHWDLVTTNPRTVTAHLHDGTDVVIYRDGQFTLDI